MLLFVLSVTIVSCEKNEPSASSNTNSSLSNNLLSGKIDSFISGSVDSVLAYLKLGNKDTTHFGYETIASDGSFSIKTTITPASSGLVRFYDMFDEDFTGSISDTNTYVSKYSMEFYASRNGVTCGEILKTNYNSFEKEDSTGASMSVFVYSDRELKVSGKEIHSYNEGKAYSETYTANYDFILKKGWNELVMKRVYYNQSATGSVKTETSLTSNITSDLKWRFFPDNLRSASIESYAHNMNPLFGFIK